MSGITCYRLMGLVGYLGDEMRRRSKEIALRKVNGASTADVLRLWRATCCGSPFRPWSSGPP